MCHATPISGCGLRRRRRLSCHALPRPECLPCGPCGKPNRRRAHNLCDNSLCLMTASWRNTCTNDALDFLPLKHTLSLFRFYNLNSIFYHCYQQNIHKQSVISIEIKQKHRRNLKIDTNEYPNIFVSKYCYERISEYIRIQKVDTNE